MTCQMSLLLLRSLGTAQPLQVIRHFPCYNLLGCDSITQHLQVRSTFPVQNTRMTGLGKM